MRLPSERPTYGFHVTTRYVNLSSKRAFWETFSLITSSILYWFSRNKDLTALLSKKFKHVKNLRSSSKIKVTARGQSCYFCWFLWIFFSWITQSISKLFPQNENLTGLITKNLKHATYLRPSFSIKVTARGQICYFCLYLFKNSSFSFTTQSIIHQYSQNKTRIANLG